jgi:hypothetical protein
LEQQRSDAERRQTHDPADDQQAEFLQFLDDEANVFVALAADDQRDAEKQRDDHDRQNVALGQCLERILEQAAEKLGDVVGQGHLARLVIGRAVGKHGQLQSFARPEEIGRREAEQLGGRERAAGAPHQNCAGIAGQRKQAAPGRCARRCACRHLYRSVEQF